MMQCISVLIKLLQIADELSTMFNQNSQNNTGIISSVTQPGNASVFAFNWDLSGQCDKAANLTGLSYGM